MKKLLVTALVMTAGIGAALASSNNDESALEFDSQNQLMRPQGLENWVYMGTNLGMTYIGSFDEDDPGHFSTVLMEPNAYKKFLKTGKFEDGTAFAKIIYESDVTDGGVAMTEQVFLEIHVRDKVRFPETGSGFYNWTNEELGFKPTVEPDMCSGCHKAKAEYEDVFTQFYPTIKHLVPAQSKTDEE